jgi:polysaccharide biosynthesis protein PslA
MAFHGDGSVGRDSRGRVLGGVAPALRPSGRIKRVCDIVAATGALVLLSPIILIVCIAIKLDSRGPIFSRETAYGYKNRAFRALRFRSVTAVAEADPSHSHVTRVGRVLHRTGIDELPQLFNVLGGAMSIVGPRPYARRQDLLENRLMPLLDGVKPGLTGWAQINESREGFWTMERRINEDLYYVKNWSLFLDIKIILKTLVSRKIAYQH